MLTCEDFRKIDQIKIVLKNSEKTKKQSINKLMVKQLRY